MNNRRLESVRPYGGRQVPVSGAVTALTSDGNTIYTFDTSAGAGTLQLPFARQWTQGAAVGVVNRDGGNTITISPQAGETINGSANFTVTAAQAAQIKLLAPGPGSTDWIVG